MLKFLVKGALALGAAGLVLEGIKKLTESKDETENPMPKTAPRTAETPIEPLTVNSTKEGVHPDGLTVNTVERPQKPADDADQKDADQK